MLKRNRQRGFTLIDLLVAVVIVVSIGLLSFFAPSRDVTSTEKVPEQKLDSFISTVGGEGAIWTDSDVLWPEVTQRKAKASGT